MKKIPVLLIVLSLGLLQGCGNSMSDDSKKMADSANEANMPKDTGSPATLTPVAVSEGDASFAVEAANGGLAEVALGKLAQTVASNKNVKSFGQMMVDDHSKVNEELKKLAQSKNITLPASVGQEEQKVIDGLNKKSGKDFDKAYIDAMIDDHKKDIKLFEDASQALKDPELKAFAVKTLPTLKMHLTHCQQVYRQL